jgi:hypothetical protein
MISDQNTDEYLWLLLDDSDGYKKIFDKIEPIFGLKIDKADLNTKISCRLY